MRPAATPSTLVVTSGNAGLATMTSRVDPEGARRMMEMLVNLYADRRLAVVREYVSNAVDASRVAGSTEPVEITAPTLLEPNFIVTDRGIGMSVDEVEATFLAFAASTKRDTNDLVGGLGVGAKSAWAITESFLVDTVKDGKRTLVRAARDLSHQVLLAGEPTDLPTGTTISVPVELGNHSDEWRRVVTEVATAHDSGAVIVDGKRIASIAAGPARIGPVLCKRIRNGYGDSVMIRSGGTLFSSIPAINSRVQNVTKLSACVIELPIGSFDHTPSRESIVATDRTTVAVEAALAEFTSEFAALEQRINTLAHTDVAAAVKLRHSVVGDVASYNVLPINFTLRVPEGTGSWTVGGRRSRGAWVRTTTVDRDEFAATHWGEELQRTVVVTGLPKGRALRAFATYLKNNHSLVRRVIAVPQGSTGVELTVIDPKHQPTGQTVTFDAAMVPESNRYTFEKWTEVTKVQRAARGTVAAGYQCVLVAQDGAQPATVELTAQEIADYNLPVWYAEGEPVRQSTKATKASIGVYLGRRKESPLLAAVPAAMTQGEWQSLRYSTQTAAWSRTVALAVVAHSSNNDATKRFRIAAEARDRIAAAGGETVELLDQIAAIHAEIEKVTPEQEAVWEAGRVTDAGRKLREELWSLDRSLNGAYPLLANVGGYGSRCDDEAYIEYVTAVPARKQ
jgi:hypothetical protein